MTKASKRANEKPGTKTIQPELTELAQTSRSNRMTKRLVVPLVLAFIALVACGKATSGKSCTQKSDCADGLGCYMIGINFTCYSKEEGVVACKASPSCKGSNKCTATENATNASEPEYMMGGCE